MEDKHIVIFDGVCNFCNWAVNFIIKRDPKCVFVFTPMQSQLAQQLINQYKVNNVGVDTFLLIKNNECYIYTTAALEIAKDLSAYWPLTQIFKIIPAPVRDFLYRVFARNRYKLFGRKNECMVPSKEVRARFIGI